MIRTSGASSVDHIINETSFLLTREIVDLGRPGVGVGVLETPMEKDKEDKGRGIDLTTVEAHECCRFGRVVAWNCARQRARSAGWTSKQRKARY